MSQFIPYLAFNGSCRQAMQYYEKVLGGKITIMMSGADSPVAEHIPKETSHRILHARMELPDGSRLFAGDAPAHMPFDGQKGVSIALSYSSVAEAERVFKALSEGGTITMPWAPSFWAKMFGMTVDKYGTAWMVNGEELPLT